MRCFPGFVNYLKGKDNGRAEVQLQALSFFFAVVAASATLSAAEGIEKFDANMAVQSGAQADGLKWIDGRDLPLEGRAFADTEFYYDRLLTNVTEKVNRGVRNLLACRGTETLAGLLGATLYRSRPEGTVEE